LYEKSTFFSLLILINATAYGEAHFKNCHIVETVSAGDVNAHVRLDCAISPRPACATARTWFAFDKSTDSGKQYFGLMMMAFSAGMVVTGYVSQGEGSCPGWQSNVSLLQHIRIKKQ
jgi:hypothetical protein